MILNEYSFSKLESFMAAGFVTASTRRELTCWRRRSYREFDGR